MHGGLESAARWSRHYYETAKRHDEMLADLIRTTAPAERSVAGFYDWVHASPSADSLWRQIYNYQGSAMASRAAWNEACSDC
jgi:hypothetical protein